MEFFRLNSQYCKHPRHKFHTWDLLTHCMPKFLAYYRQMLLSSPFAVYVQYKCTGMKICLFLLKKTKEDNLTHESIKSMNIYYKCISFALSYMFYKSMLKFTGDLNEHWSISYPSNMHHSKSEFVTFVVFFASYVCMLLTEHSYMHMYWKIDKWL